MPPLGERIRARRKELRMSQGELAELAGMTASFVSQVERNVTSPSIDSLYRISKALSVPVFHFLLEPEAKSPVVRHDERVPVHWPSSRPELAFQLLSSTTSLDRRPQLRAALDASRKHGATLIIAKLDRLARNVHFVSGLLETGCDFVAADMPQANKVMIQMHAVMSEWERDQISARTKSALAAAKARGVKLGTAGPANLKRNIKERVATADAFALKLSGVIQGLRAAGMSQRKMVEELNRIGIRTAKGGEWSLIQLQRVIKRIAPAV